MKKFVDARASETYGHPVGILSSDLLALSFSLLERVFLLVLEFHVDGFVFGMKLKTLVDAFPFVFCCCLVKVRRNNVVAPHFLLLS